MEYIKGPNHHMLSLTRSNTESSQILQQWNLAALYEITSWISDTLKIKATKIIPGQQILKVNCIHCKQNENITYTFCCLVLLRSRKRDTLGMGFF